MQVVAAGVADVGMDALDVGFRLLQVVAELGFAAHGTLGLYKRCSWRLKLLRGSNIAPSLKVAKRTMSMSIPTAVSW